MQPASCRFLCRCALHCKRKMQNRNLKRLKSCVSHPLKIAEGGAASVVNKERKQKVGQPPRPTILTGTVAKLPSRTLSSSYDPKRDVLIDYAPTDPKMKPYGFSGAAAWKDRPKRSAQVWTADPMMFGVQTSAFMKSRLLQVVGAPTIKEFLEGSF